MNEKLTFEQALTAAQELQAYALKSLNLWSVDIRTGGSNSSRYVSIFVYPINSDVLESKMSYLTTQADVDALMAYIESFKHKTEKVEVRLLVSYETDGRLSSEEAMNTAADLVINRKPVSVVDGVRVTSVEVAETNLQF